MKTFEVLNRKILFSAFLSAFLIVSVIPLLISGGHLLRRTEDELKSSLNENNYLITRHISSELDEFQVEKWISTLNGLSASLASSGGAVQNDPIVNSFFSQVRELVLLSIRTGSRPEAKHYINRNFIDELKGQRADSLAHLFAFRSGPSEAEGAADIQQPIFWGSGKRLLLPIVITRRRSPGGFETLRGVFDLAPVFDFINSEMSTVKRQIYLLDGRGRILFQNRHGRLALGEPFPFPDGSSRPRPSPVFQTFTFKQEGKKFLGYLFPTPRTGLQVAVVYAHEQAYALVSQMKRQITMSIGLVLGLSVLMSFLFAWFHSSVIYHAKEVLQRYAEKLEQSNAELEAFAYSVTHELSAPLRHIMSYSDILEMRLSGSLDAKSLHQLQNISAASKHLHELIYNILLFSRVGYADLHKTQIDVRQTVKAVRAKLEAETASRRISWKAGRCPALWGDPVMIQQVFFNLVSNAVKFTRNRKRAVIQVSAVRKTDEVVVAIRDNGTGFDMQDSGKLFGMFQRLHLREGFEGTGVGLALVRRIVAKHGGRTWAEGETGKGAAFYFSLPVEAAPDRSSGKRSKSG